jgi:hypothetical protein
MHWVETLLESNPVQNASTPDHCPLTSTRHPCLENATPQDRLAFLHPSLHFNHLQAKKLGQ